MARNRKKLNLMSYKSYTFPFNPATCEYSLDRSYAKHRYPELDGVELEDMDSYDISITGDGEFFGSDAYDNWVELNNIFMDHGPGEFYHPIFRNVSDALMVNLKAKLEPRENYVAYSFEFIAHTPRPESLSPDPLPSGSGSSTSGGGTSNAKPKVGDIVICNGRGYYTSYGQPPTTKEVHDKRMTVTYTNYKSGATRQVHVGSYGWFALSDVKVVKAGG